MTQQEAHAIVSEVTREWPEVRAEIIDKYARRVRAGYQVRLRRRVRLFHIHDVEDWSALKEMWRSEQLEERRYA